jgi:cell division protein FtsW
MDEQSEKLFNTSKYFVVVTLLIILFGLIMVYSSSYIYAKEIYGASSYYFSRQLIFIIVGIVLAFVVSKTKIDFWLKYGVQINFAIMGLILLSFIPGIGSGAKGANRWIEVLGMRFQPGELLKITVALSGVYLFDKWDEITWRRRAIAGLSIILPLILIIKQPDFGTFAICGLVLAFSCFMSKFSRKLFYLVTTTGFVLSAIVLFSQTYRVNRVLAYLDPWKNPKGSGFQIIQSYLAFANGSIFGQGLGNSTEKLFYLPEAHNDFIFSIVGAELGFVGVIFTVLLFLSFIFLGFKIALNLKNRLHTVLVSAFTFSVGIQAFLNMGVVLGLLPTKGLNLPFISSGGSSLLGNCLAMGLILSAVKFSLQREVSYYGEDEGFNFSQSNKLPL